MALNPYNNNLFKRVQQKSLHILPFGLLRSRETTSHVLIHVYVKNKTMTDQFQMFNMSHFLYTFYFDQEKSALFLYQTFSPYVALVFKYKKKLFQNVIFLTLQEYYLRIIFFSNLSFYKTNLFAFRNDDKDKQKCQKKKETLQYFCFYLKVVIYTGIFTHNNTLVLKV